VSTVYVQVHLPITNVLCLDMAIREAGGTWNAPEIIHEIRRAKAVTSEAEGTQNTIIANNEYARLLKSLTTSAMPSTITVKVEGRTMRFTINRGRYSLSTPAGTQSGLQQTVLSISKLYDKNMKLIENELNKTIQTLEHQKDILSAEQVQSLRSVIEGQQNAIQSANKERVVEVTKEIEEKLAARGFEIRKRMVGKKIVYQAVRR
tara:strand:+ start:8547 stop:9161 length:615 start_codon:yes stop_codon:yes gene_type:complete